MEILIKPIVTEKMTGQTEDLKCYGFIVDKRANKIGVAGIYRRACGLIAKEWLHGIRKIKMVRGVCPGPSLRPAGLVGPDGRGASLYSWPRHC